MRASWVALGLVFTSVVSAPRDAHALAGLLGANPVLIAIGAVGTAGAAVSATYAGIYLQMGDSQSTAAQVGLWTSIGLIILGVVVLDGETIHDTRFGSLTAVQAQDLHLTSDEWAAYENNREELNSLLEEASAASAHAGSQAEVFASAVRFWEAEGSALDPQAFDVAQRLVRSVAVR